MTEVATRPVLPPERYDERVRRAAGAARNAGFDALLIAVGPDLQYLIGYAAMPLERLTMLVLGAGRPTLVVPRLELPAAEAVVRAGVEIVSWQETDDPHALVARLAGTALRRVGVSERLWAAHLLRLEERMRDVRFDVASNALRELRMRKDPDEIELLRRAAHAADRVIHQVAHGPLVGRTERDVARDVRERLVAEGHDEALFSIVASGPDSASPHHDPSDRVIRAGEPIVLDIGGTVGGYASDITRTIWVTGGDPDRGPDPEYRRLFDVLQGAQEEGTASARPGMPAERVDAVTRGIIADAGYGEQFIHRTGHGIGLEGHEDPYIVAGNMTPLEPGMTFSVEPGIYLEGRYGARIEDIVVCTEGGPVSLNEAPRALLVVSG